MLHFRYTCRRHQRDFVEIARRGGCHDPAEIDEIRRKTLAWLSTRFPRMVLDHFNEESCLGCKLDANGVELKEVERAILEFSRRLAAREPIPAGRLTPRGSS
ncbi:MAG TPA: hypothetical protein VE397_03695 [Stellaceae bacterium]|jgi:hypothetical protein|nr:hypothetical protein [Stellaceae bacterium]